VLRILRAAAYQRMPWKNGGGETAQIAASPPGATLDTLDWRVSMAVVAQDGPFSMFPAVDRTLCILDGAGMELDFGADGGSRVVTRDTAPFLFPADVPVQARLLAGTITDLNVMTRRGRYRHSVQRIVVGAKRTVDVAATQALLLCQDGTVTCAVIAQPEALLGERDCVMLPSGPVELSSARPSVCYLIELYPAVDASA
jgi:uncharacterized protein